ncbi:dynein-associated protein, putative [Plasmodium gaboni]|uniref:Dynein-associated protein, putative n=1 Tax=Plasmodium gaboni TaxID=647221 RepID=A0ABY1UU86_9APIC|nr:dynein-associated protein, putative [Plasmodium gaboni]
MKDYLGEYNKYLKYENPIIIEKEDEKNVHSKDDKTMKDKNIVRVIEEIRKNLKSNVLYKNDSKSVIFNDPIYYLFPSKCIKVKKAEHISYVSRVTNDEDILLCLKRIYEVLSNMYSKNMIIKEEYLNELLSISTELCRQISVTCFQRGYLLKQLFNYNIMLLFEYHKLVMSSLAFNLKKQMKQNDILNNFHKEIEKKNNSINSLTKEIINTEEMMEQEKINSEKEIAEVNIIYQNRIDKLKKNNQRKKDEFTRLLQL